MCMYRYAYKTNLFRSASYSCYGKSSVCMQFGLICHKITSLSRPSKNWQRVKYMVTNRKHDGVCYWIQPNLVNGRGTKKNNKLCVKAVEIPTGQFGLIKQLYQNEYQLITYLLIFKVSLSYFSFVKCTNHHIF